MGRLTMEEVEQMKKSGVLTDEAIKDMQDKGLVGSRKRGNRRFMKDAGKKEWYKSLSFTVFLGIRKRR